MVCSLKDGRLHPEIVRSGGERYSVVGELNRGVFESGGFDIARIIRNTLRSHELNDSSDGGFGNIPR